MCGRAARGHIKFIQKTKIREQLNILYDLIVLILMFIVMVQNKIFLFLNLSFLRKPDCQCFLDNLIDDIASV